MGGGGIQTGEFTNWLDWQCRSVTIGHSVTPPILEGKTNIARLEVSEARYGQLPEHYRQTLLPVIQDVADLLVTMRMRSTIEELRHQVELAVKAARLARIRFENGLTAYMPGLELERNRIESTQHVVEVEELCVAELVPLFIA